jgi:hypothetical protein
LRIRVSISAMGSVIFMDYPPEKPKEHSFGFSSLFLRDATSSIW